MTDTRAGRLNVLLRWRTEVLSNGGSALPTEHDLRRIANANSTTAAKVNETAVAPWRPTLEYVLARVREGSNDPVGELRESPWGLEPLPPAPGTAAGAGVGDDGAEPDDEPDPVASAEEPADVVEEPDDPVDPAEEDAEPAEEDADPAEEPPAVEEPAAAGPALEDLEFAPPDHQPPPTTPYRLSVRRGADGLVLGWPAAAAPEDGVVVYRVGSADEWPPYAPEAADMITVTQRLQAHDERPFTHAVRRVRVWRHVGEDLDDARRQPPVLHAEAPVVAPVQDAEIDQNEDLVVGQWRTLPGTSEVHVLRVPAEVSTQGRGDPRYRVLADAANLDGLVDRTVPRGHRYLYQLVAVAEIDGVPEQSEPVDRPLSVTAPLVAVTDLQAARREGTSPELDLWWTTPPAGRVAVYLTDEAPPPDIGRAPLAEGGLPQAGLPAAARLLHPVATDPSGWSGIPQVPWPAGATRVHLTPVTLLDGQARVGTTVTRAHVAAVSGLRLIERVGSQTLTFAWPEGAATVRMHLGAQNQDPGPAVSGPFQQMLPHERYLRDGGMILVEPLPPRGCSVHLVADAFHDGVPMSSPAASMNYPGLLRLSYAVTTRRNLRGRLVDLTVALHSDLDLPSPPAFVLVHNPHRLPLQATDGSPLPVAPDGGDAAPVVRFVPPVLGAGAPEIGWVADARGLEGWVRLFVDVSDDRRASVALLDPPVEDLVLTPTRTRRWL